MLPGGDQASPDHPADQDGQRGDHDPLVEEAAPAQRAVVDREPDQDRQDREQVVGSQDEAVALPEDRYHRLGHLPAGRRPASHTDITPRP